MDDGAQRTPAERVVARALVDESGVGKPLSRRSMQRQRSVESYLRGEVIPRYMQRAAQIERLTRRHAHELRAAYHALSVEHAGDPAGLDQAWAALVDAWDLSEVNALVAQHNRWYPMERDLAMDPRTGDYVLVNGRPYRRRQLDRAWALAAGRGDHAEPPRQGEV